MGGRKAALSFLNRKPAACGALLAEEQRIPLCHLAVRCFHFRSLSVSSAWCLDFHNFVRLHRVQRSLVCLFLLHSLSQGLVDKREVRELVTSEKRERGVMGTSIERKRGVMGWKKREKGNQRWCLEMSAIFSG